MQSEMEDLLVMLNDLMTERAAADEGNAKPYEGFSPAFFDVRIRAIARALAELAQGQVW